MQAQKAAQLVLGVLCFIVAAGHVGGGHQPHGQFFGRVVAQAFAHRGPGLRAMVMELVLEPDKQGAVGGRQLAQHGVVFGRETVPALGVAQQDARRMVGPAGRPRPPRGKASATRRGKGRARTRSPGQTPLAGRLAPVRCGRRRGRLARSRGHPQVGHLARCQLHQGGDFAEQLALEGALGHLHPQGAGIAGQMRAPFGGVQVTAVTRCIHQKAAQRHGLAHAACKTRPCQRRGYNCPGHVRPAGTGT